MNLEEAQYEVWSRRSGSELWDFEAGSNTLEGATQFRRHVEMRDPGREVRVWFGEQLVYDSEVDFIDIHEEKG